MSPEPILRLATAADIDAIMDIERRPGFEDFVGRSSRAEHEEMFASPRHRYFVGVDPRGDVVAFAILRDLDDPHGNLYLKRIAVRSPGQGAGAACLRGLIAWAFARPHVHRFHLDCLAHNARARGLYEKLGFSRDGVLRQAYLAADGRRHDLTLMALTRPDWEAAHATRPPAAP